MSMGPLEQQSMGFVRVNGLGFLLFKRLDRARLGLFPSDCHIGSSWPAALGLTQLHGVPIALQPGRSQLWWRPARGRG
jgi:hypothetical protein